MRRALKHILILIAIFAFLTPFAAAAYYEIFPWRHTLICRMPAVTHPRELTADKSSFRRFYYPLLVILEDGEFALHPSGPITEGKDLHVVGEVKGNLRLDMLTRFVFDDEIILDGFFEPNAIDEEGNFVAPSAEEASEWWDLFVHQRMCASDPRFADLFATPIFWGTKTKPILWGRFANGAVISAMFVLAVYSSWQGWRFVRRRHNVYAGRCAECGYLVSTADHTRCPECGATIERARE